jgi:hypothetical protein
VLVLECYSKRLWYQKEYAGLGGNVLESCKSCLVLVPFMSYWVCGFITQHRRTRLCAPLNWVGLRGLWIVLHEDNLCTSSWDPAGSPADGPSKWMLQVREPKLIFLRIPHTAVISLLIFLFPINCAKNDRMWLSSHYLLYLYYLKRSKSY